jgi:hypothetical protein
MIAGVWFFAGCGESESFNVTISFPDTATREATGTLRIYSIIPGEGVSCTTLQDGTNSPEDGLSTIEDQQSGSYPFDDPIAPIKVEKKNTKTRLFFIQGENNVGVVIATGCSDVTVGTGNHTGSIPLMACEPRCPFGTGDCDNDLITNGCETNLSQTYGCNTVAEPVFNLSTGTYDHDLDISITCSTPGATIYYTTDGITQPTETSARYTGIPIRVAGPNNTSNPMTIMAIAMHSDMNASAYASATYT